MLIIILCLIASGSFAAGGFEKPVLWSARSAQHGGAYASSVKGPEALLFNPASLKSDDKKELYFGISAAAGSSTAPLLTDNEVTTFSGPVTPLSIMYAQSISSTESLGIGLYGLGGLDCGFNNVNLNSFGSEFSSYRPDIYGRLSVLEFGLGYAKNLNDNFSLGVTLRQHIARGGFAQASASRSEGLGGMGIPDGTLLAISRGEFKDLKGMAFGAYTLGMNFLSDDKRGGVSVVYRSRVIFDLKSKSSGEVVYSNAGAAASGATAGRINKLSGNNSTISSSFPEAWTLSGFREMFTDNRLHLEYTWTEYSSNDYLSINGRLTNPVDGTTSSVPDVNLNWKDLHDFKIGWTNQSVEDWIFGGGYSLSLPVTDRSATGPTFAAPAPYHHFYLGLGKKYKKFRMDFAYENYFANGAGKSEEIHSTNQFSPSVSGNYETRAYAFFGSINYYLE